MRPSRSVRLHLWFVLLGVVCVGLLGSCRTVPPSPVEGERRANPIFLLFGGPLGALVECGARNDFDADDEACPEEVDLDD